MTIWEKRNEQKQQWNEYRFEGLNLRLCSNKYLTMNRVSEDKNKIVVKVAENNIFKTKYGYALIINRTKVVFVKDWQVSDNWFGIEVMLFRDYFNVKEFGEHQEFGNDETYASFDEWVKVAIAQENHLDADGDKDNRVKWSLKDN